MKGTHYWLDGSANPNSEKPKKRRAVQKKKNLMIVDDDAQISGWKNGSASAADSIRVLQDGRYVLDDAEDDYVAVESYEEAPVYVPQSAFKKVIGPALPPSMLMKESPSLSPSPVVLRPPPKVDPLPVASVFSQANASKSVPSTSSSRSVEAASASASASLPRRPKAPDLSPPRKQRAVDASPPRKPKTDDLSPPRKPRSAASTAAAVRAPAATSASPPRRPKTSAATSASPPRRPKTADRSPPRNPIEGFPSSSIPVAQRSQQGGSSSTAIKHGLLTAEEYARQEAEKEERRKAEMKDLQPDDVDNTVYRLKGKIVQQSEIYENLLARRGLITDEEKAREMKEWNVGKVQVEAAHQKAEEFEKIRHTSFAVREDDSALNEEMKSRILPDDPMAKLLQESKLVDNRKPKYRGPPPPPNRFGIPPGYRWDGTDRGSHFEKRLFDSLNQRDADSEWAYKIRTRDM